MTPLVYLHGFAGGPEDRTGQYCRAWAESRGIRFDGPDLNVPTFETLTITAQVAAVEELGRSLETPPVLVGWSLGGLIAAAAVHRGVPVKALSLLAPAFGFARRRLDVEPQVSRVWHSGTGRWKRLGPEFIEDLYFWTEDDSWQFEIPVVVLHGRRDEVVPIALSEAFVRRQPQGRLIALDDDHDLAAAASQEALSLTLAAFFENGFARKR